MFNNLVNIHDIPLLIEKIRQGRLRRFLPKLFGGRVVMKSWDHVYSLQKNWWDIPEVMERWNLLISGDADVDYCSYFMGRYFSGRRSLKSLSLGCGTGHREIDLARLGIFESIDAIDISEDRIEYAKELANEKGYGGVINYIKGDAYNYEISSASYDLVLAEQSLHHFSPLDRILNRINSFLKAEGYFVFNEFVGPSRFQWTDRQLEVVNSLLSRLPTRYKIRRESGTVKGKVHRPGRLGMILYDPTEAVESSRILPLVKEIFDLVEVRGYGGTVLQILFNDIAHNFLSKDSETKSLLRMCFETEDELLESGELPHDFVVGICKRCSRKG